MSTVQGRRTFLDRVGRPVQDRPASSTVLGDWWDSGVRGSGGLRAVAAAGGLLLLAAPSSACADPCGDINCSSGVEVRWNDGDLPDGAAAVQVCVDGECDEPEAPTGSIAPGSVLGVKDITVELRFLDGAGEIIDTWEWTGDREGDCCPHVELLPGGDGELVPVESG